MRLILIFATLLIVCCNNTKADAGHPKEQTETRANLSHSISQEKQNAIVFIDGDTIDVTTDCNTDSLIDSIVIEHKSLRCIYKHCGKGVLNLDPFSCLRNHNNSEYRELEMITTAHSIDVNGSSFYFNGKRSIRLIPPKNTSVFVKALVFMLFSNGRHQCNVLIINSLHEDNDSAPGKIRNGS
jgi:hypothetical protein